MKKKGEGRRKLVLVEWGDAWSNDGWNPGFPRTEQTDLFTTTVGWLVQTNQNGVSVVSRLDENGNPGLASFIPKGMIKRIVYLKNGDLVNQRADK